jgi:hypothetical protein
VLVHLLSLPWRRLVAAGAQLGRVLELGEVLPILPGVVVELFRDPAPNLADLLERLQIL